MKAPLTSYQERLTAALRYGAGRTAWADDGGQAQPKPQRREHDSSSGDIFLTVGACDERLGRRGVVKVSRKRHRVARTGGGSTVLVPCAIPLRASNLTQTTTHPMAAASRRA